ncbi:GDSL-type esterase/lipase family protein [Nocardiopsis exhalans]|uniref:GDSL-type esterase/lipase family protein n=1 Tax=Nocardiopsis exhalans TaxID=163604 RepID=A0ABY5DAI1_9ACTN|nr:GDSL-type esterase/lipase family protein [Nocardiopsis exhalans]USY21359.1 GDSL-type esterase/lipase family protein [Nocardiopsis exhalans]
MSAPSRIPRSLLSAGVGALILLLAGSGLWILTRLSPAAEDPSADPDSDSTGQTQVRIMLAGDSMTQGADGDKTWRFHLWNHLDPHVESLDFVGPFTSPATPEQIIPPELTGGEPDDGDPDSVEYRDPDFDQDHNARWGRTLDEAATTIEEDVRAYQPDVLCAMIGVNDLLFPISAEEMEERLRSYVLGARAANPEIRILLAQAPRIALADSDEGFALRLYVYNELVQSVSEDLSTEQSPVVSFDLAGAELWDTAEDTYDGTHPNGRGELKIAAGFADALSREFGLGPAYPRPLPSST